MEPLLVAVGPVALAADGSVWEMVQYDTAQYCALQGGHLPSTREFAAFAIKHGAMGILEPSQYNNQIGYLPIYRLNDQNQVVVDLYYNQKGYVEPPG